MFDRSLLRLRALFTHSGFRREQEEAESQAELFRKRLVRVTWCAPISSVFCYHSPTEPTHFSRTPKQTENCFMTRFIMIAQGRRLSNGLSLVGA